jgi:hypothetical protein
MNAIFTDLYDFGNSSDDFALSSYRSIEKSRTGG